jgi:hypothetical protein
MRTEAQFGNVTRFGTLQQSINEVECGILPFTCRRKNSLAKRAKISILLGWGSVHKHNLTTGTFRCKSERAFFFKEPKYLSKLQKWY